MATVTTTKGEMDEALLVKKEGIQDEEDQIVHWIEYRLPDGELVHRSVHITKKGGVGIISGAGQLG